MYKNGHGRPVLLIVYEPGVSSDFFSLSSSVIDADNDIVRCRLPNTTFNTDECGYLCGGLPGSALDTVCVYLRGWVVNNSLLKNLPWTFKSDIFASKL